MVRWWWWWLRDEMNTIASNERQLCLKLRIHLCLLWITVSLNEKLAIYAMHVAIVQCTYAESSMDFIVRCTNRPTEYYNMHMPYNTFHNLSRYVKQWHSTIYTYTIRILSSEHTLGKWLNFQSNVQTAKKNVIKIIINMLFIIYIYMIQDEIYSICSCCCCCCCWWYFFHSKNAQWQNDYDTYLLHYEMEWNK